MSEVLVADPPYLKACCADLWAHPGVRLLVGDSMHPGGLDLTRETVSGLRLPAGSRVLDLGCGAGPSAEWIVRAGLRAVGLDYSHALAAEAAARVPEARFAAGDAERLPFADRSFEGLIAECVLSAIPDKDGAVEEMARVLRPRARLAVSDVVVEGSLPPELKTFASWIACAAGALPARGYEEILWHSGFEDLEVEDRSSALADLLAKARRRLALFRGSVAAGLVRLGAGPDPELVTLGDRLLGLASRVLSEGGLGYVLILATRAG